MGILDYMIIFTLVTVIEILAYKLLFLIFKKLVTLQLILKDSLIEKSIKKIIFKSFM